MSKKIKYELTRQGRHFLKTDDLVRLADASDAGKAYVDTVIPMFTAATESLDKEPMSFYNRDQMVLMFIAGAAWKEGLVTREIGRLREVYSTLHNNTPIASLKERYKGRVMGIDQVERFLKTTSNEKDNV